MNVSQFFTASLTSPTVPDLHAVQGDSGRIIVARLFAEAEPWIVPDDVVGLISYTLPDGTAGCYEQLSNGTPGCTIMGNQVAVTIAPGLCRMPGIVKAVIILRKGEQQISTFPFRLHVMERPGKTEVNPDADVAPPFAGKLYYGDLSGNPMPLGIGEGLRVTDGHLIVPENDEMAGKDYVDERIAALRADLEYEAIEITGISVEPSVELHGRSIVNPTVSWALSKAPVEQTVSWAMTAGGMDQSTTEVDVDPALRSTVVEGSFHAKAPGGSVGIALRVVDERGAVAEKTASMVWHNAVYYTDQWTGGMPKDAEFWGMPQKIQGTRGVTISAASGDGAHVLYACPKRMGTPEFWANGFQGGFQWLGNANHINAAGYREEYSVYISEAAGLTATISVK